MILTYKVTPKLNSGKKLIIPIMMPISKEFSNFAFYNPNYISVSFKYNKKYIARLFSPNFIKGEEDYYIKIKPSDYNKFIKLSLDDLQKWFDNV